MRQPRVAPLGLVGMFGFLALLAGCASRANTPGRTPAPASSPAASDVDAADLTPADVHSVVNPLRPTPDSLSKGRALFQRHCTACHGSRGKGDGPLAMHWTSLPKNLSDAELQKRLSDGDLFWKISKGHRSGSEVVMPGYAERLSADDRWRIVLYVRSLATP